MRWKMAAVAWLVILTGCVPVNNERPILGPEVAPPSGWAGYCARHPDDRDCC